MAKNRRSRREWQREKNQGLQKGTFKHRPCVLIPDPTYDAIFSEDKDSTGGKGFPDEKRLEIWYGPLSEALKQRELTLARERR